VAVYKIAAMPAHDDFRKTSEHAWRRTALFAAVAPGEIPAKAAQTKYISLAQRARTVFPEMPIPLRLPFGA
jgi:hypothetical protein